MMIWKPWTLFTVAVAGWMSQQQQDVIAYLREENLTRATLIYRRAKLSFPPKVYEKVNS